jgi:hypothetical protein
MHPSRYGPLLALCLAGCATAGQAAPTPDGKPAPDATALHANSGPGVPPFWVYRNGEFNWEGDYSWEALIDYHDKAGASADHKYVIAVKIVGKWGGFQPFAPGKRFDVRPYKYLVYALKPTLPDQVFATGFEAINDVADGNVVTVSGPPYGPVPVAGQWATYKVPLSAFALTNSYIQKFAIADGTGHPANLFYVDNVGFTAE